MSADDEPLPPGWAESRLGDVLSLKYGKALPERVRDGVGAPVYGSNGIVGYHSKPMLAGPAILVGRKGSIGAVHLSDGPCSAIDTAYFIDEFHGQPPRFWYQLLRNLDLASLNRATALPGLNREDAYDMTIRVPPVEEQGRIVAKLDELLASSRAARAALDAVPALVPDFARSLLAAGFDGRLTEDVRVSKIEDATEDLAAASRMRETSWSTLLQDKTRIQRRSPSSREKKCAPSVPPDLSHGVPDLPPGWAIASVSQLAFCLDSFRVPVKRENRGKSGGYPYFGANGRVGEIDDYIFDLDLLLVTEDETFYGRTKPIAYRVSGKCWVNNHAHALLPLSPFTTEFLHYALMHYDVEPWLSGTTGRAKLTQADLLKLPILVPPAHEREELCRRIRLGLETGERMSEQASGVSVKVTALENACIRKAMRGELVPQTLSDEPASGLLERLRTTPMTAPAGRRTRRTSTPA